MIGDALVPYAVCGAAIAPSPIDSLLVSDTDAGPKRRIKGLVGFAMTSTYAYAEKDWLVHSHYGIGQVKGIEVKGISGADVHYFRIETTDSTYWVPVDQMDNEKMRPLSSPEEFELAVEILARPANEMSSDHNARKNRIRSVNLLNTPEDTARLIRDLRARQLKRGELNLDESTAMRALKQRLVDEWSLVTGKKVDKITSQLDELLEQN